MKRFDKLPEFMQNDAVLEYYNIVKKHRCSRILKRIMDFVIALILTVILLIPMLMIGILITCTSKGGPFFCQTRVTTYGRTFRIIKFRTMVSGADRMGSQVTTNGDARVTSVGRFLRKVRLDELPQLFNILKGDMSLVGTRPEVVKYVESYTNEMKATLLLPAGVTSRASIEYKDEEKLLSEGDDVDWTYVNQVLPEKMKYNLSYLKDFSILTDLKLMVQTVFAVL